MAKLIDLTDKVFNGWKVLNKLPSKKGKTYWLCECEKCQNQREFQGTHLRNETVAKCSCQNKMGDKQITKICEICGKEFNLRTKGHNRKYCYECSPSSKDRSSTITSIRHAIKHQLILYKGGKCEICGYNKCEGSLQFHHLNPKEKDFDLASQYNNGKYDIKSLYNEINKCILVCANCHGEIHYNK